MKIINKINNELIDIREYAKPKAYFNLQLDNPSEYYEFCIFHEQFNPFDLFNDNKIKGKEIERLHSIIKEAIEYINLYEYTRYCPSPYEKEKYIMREEKEGQDLLNILQGEKNE